MSFSSKIKNEILDNTTNKECCKICIRYGELATEDRNLNMSTVKSVINSRTCCEKAFLKGVFLGSGCITLPTEDRIDCVFLLNEFHVLTTDFLTVLYTAFTFFTTLLYVFFTTFAAFFNHLGKFPLSSLIFTGLL